MMVRINLIPRSIQIAQAYRRRVKQWAVAMAVAVVTCAVPAVGHWRQHGHIDELRLSSDRLQADLAAARAELRAVSSQANDLVLRSERAKALRGKRSWSSMLALIANCLPPECWLTSLATDPPVPSAAPPVRKAPAAPLAAVAPGAAAQAEPPPVVTIDAPRKMRIHGHSGDATQPLAFVARLKESHVFRDVSLERAHRAGEDPAAPFKFEVLCEW
jgi:Tfp pilus assembly protein PilN